ncbi:MAG TPA: TonB-dependent receptor, partial [Segetibacter sp.]
MSQKNYQSKLADSATGKPVAFTTISVYKISNATKPVQNIIAADDGSFKLTIKDSGSYNVVIFHASYHEKTYLLNASFPENILLVPKLNKIGEVLVTVRKPLVEKVEDKLIYNVEADASLDGQMATDALRKTPFISVDGDGNVQLKGQSNFKVLLNGKESAMFAKDPKEALKAFPANMIKRIEVITNPSSKYDAEGVAGIINIITGKKVTGYNGNIGAYYNTLNNMNLNASANVKLGKIGLAGYVGLGGNKNPPAGKQTSITEALQPVVYAKRSLLGESKNSYNWQNGNLELSWDIDSLNTLSAYGNIGGNDNKQTRQRNLQVISADLRDTANYVYTDDNRYKYPWYDVGMDYIRKFKKENQELTVKFNHQYSDDKSLMNSSQFYANYNRFAVNDNTSANHETTVQADFVLPLPKSTKLELGAKGIVRSAAADYISMYRYDLNKTYNADNANTDNFYYDQSVYSGYFTYGFKIKKWSVRLGARVEHTEVNGDFTASNVQVKQNYNNLIPSFYLSKKLKDKHDLSFSYSKRLRRPYIWNLNPFVNNTDSLNISYGNPSLQPELTHSFEIGYSYFKNATSINIKLSENYCNNQVIQFSQFNNTTGVSSKSPLNIGKNF